MMKAEPSQDLLVKVQVTKWILSTVFISWKSYIPGNKRLQVSNYQQALI
jgi:hypothetical protein